MSTVTAGASPSRGSFRPLRNLGDRGLRRADLSQPRVGPEPVECGATECESRELNRKWVHEEFSRNLLSCRQLAQPWAYSRPKTYGSGIPKPHSSRQRSTCIRRSAMPLRISLSLAQLCIWRALNHSIVKTY